MQKKIGFIMAVMASLALIACGGTPGNAEVREALTQQAVAIGGKAGAKAMQDDIEKVKVISCTKADAGGFKCDWTSPMGAASGRIVKSDSGWVLVGG